MDTKSMDWQRVELLTGVIELPGTPGKERYYRKLNVAEDTEASLVVRSTVGESFYRLYLHRSDERRSPSMKFGSLIEALGRGEEIAKRIEGGGEICLAETPTG